MGYTQKQERNGATGNAGGQNSAQPSSVVDVAPVQAQAESAGLLFDGDGHALLASPQGAGSGGHTVGGGGSMFEWDAGLAINDYEGGGSG